MRINRYIALSSNLSRRSADTAISEGRVTVNGLPAKNGQQISQDNIVTLDNKRITPPVNSTTIIINKPVGFVCSRHGQGSQTIYDLLPPKYKTLKPAGRLDKNSSGLLLMSTNGYKLFELTHPKFQKSKIYEITIDKPLHKTDFDFITKNGVDIGDDSLSKFHLQSLNPDKNNLLHWRAELTEGRNRQIRRTFRALDYKIVKLHRVQFGPYKLGQLAKGKYQILSD